MLVICSTTNSVAPESYSPTLMDDLITVLWPSVVFAATRRKYGRLSSPRSGTLVNVTDPDEPVHVEQIN